MADRPSSLIQVLLPRSVIFAASAVAGVSLALWLLPGSPVTLWRADAAIGTGDAAAAVALYDDVGASGWTASMRRAALRRSAALLSTELQQPDAARSRLRALLALETDVLTRAELFERVAHLYLEEGQLESAEAAFESAWREAPQHAKAGERLVAAARAASELGAWDRANERWTLIAENYPPLRGTALLSQGRAALVRGDAQDALALFQQARDAATSPDQEAAARLGISSSLERLGNLDEAIAEIDGADLPASLRDRRLEQLRSRNNPR